MAGSRLSVVVLTSALALAACGSAAVSSSGPSSSAAASAAPKPASATGSPSPAPKANGPAVAASGAPSAKPGVSGVPAKFTVPYTAYSGAFAPLWVAGDENFFAKHGFNVNVQYMEASLAASGLLSGELPFSSTPAIVSTIVAGGDAIILAKLITFPKFSLYASKDIQRVEDLKGKTLADTQRGTAPDTAVRDLLAKHGLKEGDVKFAYLPNPSASLATMVAGQASAAILPAPVTVQARSQGYVEITDTAKENVPGLAAAVSTKRERLKDNPDSIRAYLSAIKEATAFLKANPVRTKAIIGKYAKTDVPAEQEETYITWEPLWNLSPVRTEDIAAVLRYSNDPKAATANPATFFDNSFIDSLQ